MKLAEDSLSPTRGQMPADKSAQIPSAIDVLKGPIENVLELGTESETSEDLVSSVPEPEMVEGKDAITLTSTKILEIIFDYALNKFDDSRERLEAGRPKFMGVLNGFVAAGAKIDMALPAFPFKSANKVEKALGFLPDMAEELALARLHNMCKRIEEVYKPGAMVVIISDGLVYNDLLSISDRHTWLYGQALRAMAIEKGFTNIDFSRLRNFVPRDAELKLPETLDEISYVANATNFRRYILNKFGKDDLDPDHLIATEEDTRLTYQGYCRFLTSDLKYIFTTGVDRTGKAYKRETKYLAKQMLIRGYAFAGAVKHNFPHHLRLSIHESTGEHKVSMSLLNTKTGFTTPWHCTVAQMADGEWVSAPAGDFRENPRMKVVEERGRPSYFREMTEAEYQEDLRLAEEAAKQAAKPKVEELKEVRNEDFIHWESLSYEVSTGGRTKQLLDGVDGWLRGGTLTALMGAGGSETALFDVLADNQKAGVVQGDLLVNGLPQNMASKNVLATVYQQDLDLPAATVKEILTLSALIRQPSTTSFVENIAHAEEVLSLVGMEAFADTTIGASGEYLNSEQRKRLSIGVELAAKPTTLLLLDQPVAGLDSKAALSICNLLRQLAQRGLAILCVVNQPSARLLQTFDRLLLLGQGGKQLYFGKIGNSCKTMVKYFEQNGARKCDANENPAEWMLDVTSSSEEYNEIWKKSPEQKAVKSKLAQLKKKFAASADLGEASQTSTVAEQTSTKFHASTLQRAFYNYQTLANMPADRVLPPWVAHGAVSHAQSNVA